MKTNKNRKTMLIAFMVVSLWCVVMIAKPAPTQNRNAEKKEMVSTIAFVSTRHLPPGDPLLALALGSEIYLMDGDGTNVRRLTNMIKESVADGTRWVVFEPNDHTLWKSIRRDIGAFLTNVWRDGALLGTTPQQAFFVKCDEETNPPEVRDAGQVVTLIGIAPVKPAEFVIFKLMQSAEATSETESAGA